MRGANRKSSSNSSLMARAGAPYMLTV